MSPQAERLTASRERLRLAMAGPGSHAASGDKRPTSEWVESLKSNPVGAVLIDTAVRWWAHHPLHLAGKLAAEATTAVVRPMAQRNPLGLVLAALFVGGALAWSRPWRWLLTPALLAGLAPRIFSKLTALVPAQSWMALLASLSQAQRPEQRQEQRQEKRQEQGQEQQQAQRQGAAPPEGQAAAAASKNE